MLKREAPLRKKSKYHRSKKAGLKLASATLELTLARASQEKLLELCTQLAHKVDTLQVRHEETIVTMNLLKKELGRDEETMTQMKTIQENPPLKDYYNKLCELTYYIRACQTTSTTFVAKCDDTHDLKVRVASGLGRALFSAIPMTSGLSYLLDIAEKGAYVTHDFQKHQYFSHIVRWTSGLDIHAMERLIHSFARRLTLENQDNILTQTISFESVMRQISEETVNRLREISEGQSYSPQQKLALAHTFKILDAIGSKTIEPPKHETGEERIALLLDTMVTFMQEEPSLKYHYLSKKS